MLLEMWKGVALTLKSFVSGKLNDEVRRIASFIILILRVDGMSRVKFNTYAFEWSKCMETCPKYNKAQVPSFSDQQKMEELVRWMYHTTTDADTDTLWPDTLGRAFWIPFRQARSN